MESNSVPDDKFCCIPWMSYDTQNKKFMMKYLFAANSYHIMITDLMVCYYEEVSGEELLVKCKELNPRVEIQKSRLFKHLQSTLDNCVKNPDVSDKELAVSQHDEKTLDIICQTELASMSFVWQFNLRSLPPSYTFDHVMKPVMVMTNEFEECIRMFMGLLHSKDEEISAYKKEGAKLAMSFMETRPFNEEEFNSSMSTPKSVAVILKKPISTILTSPYFSKTVAAIQHVMINGNEERPNGEEATTPKKRKLNKAAIRSGVSEFEDSYPGEENSDRREELHQRMLLQQRLNAEDEKKSKKPRKKAFKI